MSSTALPVTGPARRTSITTLLLVLAGESVLFGTLLMAYLFLRGSSTGWPPIAHTWQRLAIPLIILLVLLASQVVMWRTWSAWQAKNELGLLRRGLSLGLALGVLFLLAQVFEFNRSGMRPDDAAFGGLFFVLIAFHAVHVLAGLVLQASNLVRAGWGDFDRQSHTALDVGFYFWSFVVAVWLILFAALYLA